MTHVGLTAPLRIVGSNDSYTVGDPSTQEGIRVNGFVYDVLQAASSGDHTIREISEDLADEYGVATAEASEKVFESIVLLRDRGWVRTDPSPLPTKETHTTERPKFSRVLLSVTKRCHWACDHCLQGQKDNASLAGHELTTEQWKSVIDQLHKLGVQFLFVTGGEPLLREDTVELMEYAADYGFSQRLYTTASVIGEETADRLADIDAVTVQTSLHSITPEAFASITNRGDSYERVTDGIRQLTDRGVRVAASTSFSGDTVDEMTAFPGELISLGVSEWLPTLIMPLGCAKRDWEELRMDDEDMTHFLDEFLRQATIYKDTELDIENRFIDLSWLQGTSVRDLDQTLTFGCNPYEQYIYVQSDGSVSPCDRFSEFTLGNLQEHSFEELLDNDELLRQHHKEIFEMLAERGIDDVCEECEYYEICGGGCPSILTHGHELNEEYDDPVVCRIIREHFDTMLEWASEPARQRLKSVVGMSARGSVETPGAGD